MPHKTRFGGVKGMTKLIAALHKMKFKVGLYSSAGDYTISNSKTGGHNPGSWGFEEDDAMAFTKWGIDYL